jgi:hypothetical protein
MSVSESYFVLPLSALPLVTPALSSAQMVKNVRLDGVLQLYAHEGGGRGNIRLKDLPLYLDSAGVSEQDLALLDRVASLPSYDPYSLRLTDIAKIMPPRSPLLALSPGDTQRAQTYHMDAYKLPLLQFIYGDSAREVAMQPDKVDVLGKLTREKLENLAQRLEIPVHEVPQFLQEYSDLFLSAAHYEASAADLESMAAAVTPSVEALSSAPPDGVMATVREATDRFLHFIKVMMEDIKVLIENIKAECQALWHRMERAGWDGMKARVHKVQPLFGAAICALAVKLRGWLEQFQTQDAGSLASRSACLMQDMIPGLSRVRRLPIQL